jgi:glyoxylase-like metal-dependent hydrolase (beta-lactamase superfamily II)/rhodanese-related sulfurtransferase
MKVEQIYTGCLAQGAYYIMSNGEAAIIDPLREVQPYLDRAQRDGVKIKYVFETHFHADFVSGHLDLSKKSGAPIVYGPNANPEFEAHIAKDGEVFTIGNVTITALHTPGHTLESTTYLLKDEQGKDIAIFTGDTLFLGDVGRPDLAQKAADITMEDLAGMLYDSLQSKIMPLAADVTVYPGHGAGSACGKNMMKETVDTLGHQKEMNYALLQPSREAFIAAVTDGLSAPPAYFPGNVMMNKKGYDSYDSVMERGNNPLSIDAFVAAVASTDAIILDTRNPAIFHKGFVPQSINIGIDGQFAPWVGALIADVKQPIALITDLGREAEVVMRLARVGFDNVLGYLQGGYESWAAAGKEIDTVHRISAAEFAERVDVNKDKVVDVRKEGEYAAEHIENAYLRPLDIINEWTSSINENEHFFLHCAGGYRSMIAASILKSRGIHHFTEIEGGFGAIAKTSVPRTDFVCQSKVSY